MSGTLANFIVGFFRGLSSEIVSETGAVLYHLAGYGSLDLTNPSTPSEGDPKGTEAFGALGLVARYLEPDDDGSVECYAMRIDDRLVPLGWRDLRLDAAFPSGVGEGTIALTGYGGGFHSISRTATASGTKRASVHVIYAPYEFDASGVATKAHAIVIDPSSGNNGIQIVHGEGYFIAMQKDEGIRMSVDNSTFMQMAPDSFFVNAANIGLQGNVAVGKSLVGAPALNSASTSSSFFVSL